MTWLLPLLVACRTGTDPTPSDPLTTSPTATATGHTEGTGRVAPMPTSSPYIDGGPPPTNVLLLSIDTLRADHLGHHGEREAVATPAIDGLLQRGLLLRTHRSCSSWTLPSFLCVYTGRDQVSQGYFPNNREITGYPDDRLVSLATRFADAGYATRQITGNGILGDKYDLNQGFEVSIDTDASSETASLGIHHLHELAAAEAPWFLQVHFMTPHTAYDPEPRFIEADTDCPSHDLTTKTGFRAWHPVREAQLPSVREACDAHVAELYDALVREVDHYVGDVLAALDATGAAHDTVVLFVTDHGEAFDEHGGWEHGFANYDTLTRASAGFVAPGRVRVAEHVGVTSHEDLAPTLWEVLGRPVPPEMLGRPVGTVPDAHSFQLTYHAAQTVQTVSDTQGRLHYWWNGLVRYHDLATDPDELVDTYDRDDPHVQELWDALMPRIDALAAAVADEGVEPLGIEFLRTGEGDAPGLGGRGRRP